VAAEWFFFVMLFLPGRQRQPGAVFQLYPVTQLPLGGWG